MTTKNIGVHVVGAWLLALALGACSEGKQTEGEPKTVAADPAQAKSDEPATEKAATDEVDEGPTPASPPRPGQTYYLQVGGTDLFLTSPGRGNGKVVRVAALNKTPAQRWQLTANRDGSYGVMSVGSGLHLDVPDGSRKVGEAIIQYQGDGSKEQRWGLVGAAKGQYNLLSRRSNLYLTSDGKKIIQRPADGSNEQIWLFLPVDQM